MQPDPSVIRLPAIVTDIDGVLVRQKNPIKGAADGIKFLKTPLCEIDRERFSDINEFLPFACLTNSGSGTERLKAEAISNILEIAEPSQRLKGEEVIMNFTPLRPILETYQEKLVLLGGVGDLSLLAKDFGLKKYITDEEYCAIYPKLVPYRGRPESGEEYEKLRSEIAKRLNIEVSELIEPLQVHAIFMLNDPIKWDERVQIICDLLSTPDGRIAQKMPDIGPQNHIPVYCTNNDLLFAAEFRLVRMTFGCFNETLRRCYNLVYKRELEINMYGKPCQLTFDFTEKFIKRRTNFEISNFYMIGDNPKSDIRGGNGAGWKTILVKTGVFQYSEEIKNDPEDPATYVVEDFADAIKLICDLEGIKYSIN